MASSESFDAGNHVHTDTPDPEPVAEESHSAHASTEVFGNADILEKIFSFFHQPASLDEVEPRIPFPASSHLVSASLTQKSFFDPAMNILWRSMNSLEAVLFLIPTLVLKEGAYSRSDGKVANASDLDRLKHYAHHIRHFHFAPLKGTISAEISYALSRFLQGPLFPTLRMLDCGDVEKVPVDRRQVMFLLPAPTLYEVAMDGMNSSSEAFSICLLESLLETAEGMKVLRLGGDRAASIFAYDNVSGIGKHSSTLRQLAIRPTSTDFESCSTSFLTRLSSIAPLSTLSLSFKDADVTSSEQLLGPLSLLRKAELTNLAGLHISGSSSDLVRTLCYVDSPRLESLSIDLTSIDHQLPPNEAVFDGVMQQRVVLLSGAVSTVLKNLIIRIQGSRHESDGKWRVMASYLILRALPHLSSCANLRVLDIPCCLTLQSHQTLVCLCSKLLCLEVLKIDWVGVITPELDDALATLTWLLLEDLTKDCPTLKVLHIPLIIANGPSDIDVMRSRIASKALGHELEELVVDLLFYQFTSSVRRSVCRGLKNAIAVSRYIDHLFPSLRVLNIDHQFPSLRELEFLELENTWMQDVEMLVRSHQDVRRSAKGMQPASSQQGPA